MLSRLSCFPSPLVGEDRLGRSPSAEGGCLRNLLGRASSFDGARPLEMSALDARRPPSPALPHKGGEGRAAIGSSFSTIAGGAR